MIGRMLIVLSCRDLFVEEVQKAGMCIAFFQKLALDEKHYVDLGE